jgi:hypothetical protein
MSAMPEWDRIEGDIAGGCLVRFGMAAPAAVTTFRDVSLQAELAMEQAATL